MKQKLLFTLMFLMTWGTNAWGQTDEQYTAATANITAGTYRIYAVDGSGNKHYLKVSKSNYNKKECDFAITTTTFAEASTFTITQSGDGSSKEKTTGWNILSDEYVFTNPSGGSNSSDEFTSGTCLRGYKSGSRTNAYDRQVLYYDGTGYAIHACNTTSTDWGGAAYWGLDGSNNACYVAAESKAYIWHFERVVEAGYYRIYGNNNLNQSLSYLLSNADGTALANSHDGGNSPEDHPYDGNDNKDVWYIGAGSADGTYSIKNVSNNKYIQITSHNTKGSQSQTLNSSSQDVCFTDYYQYIGANSTDTYRFINLNKKDVNVWSGPDGNNQFTLYPMSAYTLTIVGQTGATVTVTAQSHSSAATNAGTVYIDDRATEVGNLAVSATVGGDDATAVITDFDTSGKTITVAVGSTTITPAYAKTTYVTTMPLDFSAVDGLKAYRASAAGGGSVTLEEVGAVPVATPLLLIGTAGTEYTVPVASSPSAPGTNLLKAGDGTTTMASSNYDYILYSDGLFYRVTSGTVTTTKAYLHCDSDPTAGADVRSLSIIFGDDESTGVQEVKHSKTEEPKSYFDLQGRRVSTPTKGLYIMNGKKVIK